jgi:hypothetical protein
MAGMFYSLKETAAKLGKTEQEVKQLSKEGNLREFRDGTSLLFKIDEVEALLAKAGPQAVESEAQPLDETVQQEELFAIQEETPLSESVGPEELESLFAIDEEQSVSEEAMTQDAQQESTDDLRLEEALQADSLQEPMSTEEGIDLSDTQHVVAAEAAEPEAGSSLEDDIFLAAEIGAAPSEGEPSGMDTALTGEGVSVLGETDKDYKLTDDTLAETMAGLGASGEGSLEEIEKDVNLDSFGSGSGLLDLSLQADDTSLGGILDEIYTPEDQKEGVPGAEGDEGMAADIAAETEQMPLSEDLGGAPMEQIMTGMGPIAAEPEPDSASNMLGGLLILSLVVMTYTIIAAASAGIFKTVPGLILITQGMIWMIVAGLAVVTVGIAAVALIKGSGSGAPKAPKPPKPKKEKKDKKKKDKKAKE